MKILLVEDRRMTAEPFIEDAQEAGHEVTWCQNAAEARRLLVWHFDAFLFDVDLGHGETGIDLARHTRETAPAAPVIVWSGLDHSAEAHAVGAVFVLKGWGAAEVVLQKLREAGNG